MCVYVSVCVYVCVGGVCIAKLNEKYLWQEKKKVAPILVCILQKIQILYQYIILYG